MRINAFQDMHHCLHFADNWEEDCKVVWNNVYLDGSTMAADGIATHCMKFAMVEEACNTCRKELVLFDIHIMFDEGRVSGWYKSSITIRPESKPIWTGAILHLMCVTFGPLAT
jgi:hypothetical protein